MSRVPSAAVSRRRRIVLGALLVVAAAAAALAANLVLLRLAEPRNDPVGKLSPKAVLTSPATTGMGTTPFTVEPGEPGHDGDD